MTLHLEIDKIIPYKFDEDEYNSYPSSQWLAPNLKERIIVSGVEFPEDYHCMRTGVISEGSCLFHSILYLLDHEDYIQKSNQERMDYVRKVRTAITQSIEMQDWLLFSNGYTAYEAVIPRVRNHLLRELDQGQWDKIEHDVTSKYQLILTESLVEQWVSVIRQHSPLGEKYLSDLFFTYIQDEFENYKQQLGDCSQWTGNDEIELLSNKLNVNILMFSANKELVNKSVYNQKLKSICMYHYSDMHWEPLTIVNKTEECLIFKN